MTCREVDEILLAGGRELPEPVREHLRGCAQCRNLVSALSSDDKRFEFDPAVLDRIRPPVLSSVEPVRPLAPAGVFMAAILILVAAAATAGGMLFGLHGLPVLSPAERWAIFSTLFAIAVLGAFAAARDMRPGARTVRGGVLFVIAIAAIETVFLSVFHDYGADRFVRLGMVCLGAGLACSVPTGLLVWLLMRRGYIVAPVSTGAAIGVVSGLTGLAALELHCPVLTIPHVAVWHVGVLVVCTGAGALVGWVARTADRRRLSSR